MASLKAVMTIARDEELIARARAEEQPELPLFPEHK